MYILEERYGNNGYAFWFKLLELLGRSEGHFIDCRNPNRWEFLQAIIHLNGNTCNEILDLLAKLEAIDSELWAKKIIWCQHFVNRLATVYANRRVEIPTRPSFYIEESPPVEVSTDGNPQSKVKESKGKESKDIDESKKQDSSTSKDSIPSLVSKAGEGGEQIAPRGIIDSSDKSSPPSKAQRRKPFHEWIDEEIGEGKTVPQCHAVWDRAYFRLIGHPPDRNYAKDGAAFKRKLAKGINLKERIRDFFRHIDDRAVELGGYTVGVFEDWCRRTDAAEVKAKREEQEAKERRLHGS
jgi:hypothetical protein